eukprot:Skav228985  [mRNA]  locus=scaffold127:51960:62503:+ [translate_table: standard]
MGLDGTRWNSVELDGTEVLNIDTNAIQPLTLESVANGTSVNQALQELRCNNTATGRLVTEAFLQALKSNPSLCKLGYPVTDAYFRGEIDKQLTRNNDAARKRRLEEKRRREAEGEPEKSEAKEPKSPSKGYPRPATAPATKPEEKVTPKLPETTPPQAPAPETAFGLASAELFQYNRENFQFDNEQRISRDVQKYKMQVERFELFREDIEDLVKLTVDKMDDMYHLVSAVVLGFTTSIFTEGRIWGASPPSYIAVYFMTIGRAHRGISGQIRAYSYWILRLYGISSKLQEFEQQGLQKVPMLAAKGWQEEESLQLIRRSYAAKLWEMIQLPPLDADPLVFPAERSGKWKERNLGDGTVFVEGFGRLYK